MSCTGILEYTRGRGNTSVIIVVKVSLALIIWRSTPCPTTRISTRPPSRPMMWSTQMTMTTWRRRLTPPSYSRSAATRTRVRSSWTTERERICVRDYMKTDDNKQLCYMVNILMSVVTIANVTGLYSVWREEQYFLVVWGWSKWCQLKRGSEPEDAWNRTSTMDNRRLGVYT